MCYETKITNLFIFKSVIIFVCSIQIETKIQELCDHICASIHSLCSLLPGKVGFPPDNVCIGYALTCKIGALIFSVLVLTNVLEDATLF